MGCARVDLDGGDFAITCTSGAKRAAPCDCGSPHAFLCDFPLSGEKAGQTCDRRLCSRCRMHIGSIDLCRAHAAHKPKQPARGRVFDHLEAGTEEEKRLSAAARELAGHAWWVCTPQRDEPAAVVGEFTAR